MSRSASRFRPATVGWAVVAVVVAGWLATVQVFWLPLRVAGVPLPLSTVAAVLGNLMIPAAIHRLSGSRWVALLPPGVWLVVAVTATIRRPEGDLVLTGGGAIGMTNILFLLLGVTAAAFSVGRTLGSAPRVPARVTAADRDGGAPAVPAGTGTGGAR